MVTKHRDCEDYVSVCCGAGSNEYAEDFCEQCREFTDFECIECASPKEPAKCPQCKYTPILNWFNYCPMCVFSLGNHVGKEKEKI